MSGIYRVRAADSVSQTSSPSMDIAKASNFERFVYDLVGQDANVVKHLWRRVDTEGEFDLSRTPYFSRLGAFGFVSGKSTHQDRLETIRTVYRDYGAIIDPHTADGVKVGLECRAPEIPLICLETALPAKFAETIRQALGREPELPQGCANMERLPQRFVVMDTDATAVKTYIAERCTV